MPLSRIPFFNPSIKKVVYKIETDKTYTLMNHLIEVDHEEYRIANGLFRPFNNYANLNYAFGIMAPLGKSDIIMFDLDAKPFAVIKILIEFLINTSSVCAIDVIKSNTGDNWHIIAKLYKEYNLTILYRDLVTHIHPGLNLVCSGFLRYIINRGYILVRVSQKFYPNSVPETEPHIYKCYRKIDTNWVQLNPFKDPIQKTEKRFSLRG